MIIIDEHTKIWDKSFKMHINCDVAVIWLLWFMPTCKEAWSSKWRTRICFVFLVKINLTWVPGKYAQKMQLEKDFDKIRLWNLIWIKLGLENGISTSPCIPIPGSVYKYLGKIWWTTSRVSFEEYQYSRAVDHRDTISQPWESINWSQM